MLPVTLPLGVARILVDMNPLVVLVSPTDHWKQLEEGLAVKKCNVQAVLTPSQ